MSVTKVMSEKHSLGSGIETQGHEVMLAAVRLLGKLSVIQMFMIRNFTKVMAMVMQRKELM